ncbi:MAG: hypothetical protein K0S47_1933 [Herbinix sp.]|jgi:subtilisin family serine protease|nr:hypothetical protein [Herbinix sp.]
MLGEDFADLILFYLNNPARLDRFKDAIIHYMNESFAVVHVPVTQINIKTVNTFGYSAMPKLFGLTSELSTAASGVGRVRQISNLNLKGTGVLIGIIDTGIDYTNPVFLKSDGTTKIVALWDQSIETENHPFNTYYGTEYRADQINLALNSTNPLEIVPSVDNNGHGTMMAAVAVGNTDSSVDFDGVAPDSELIVVKLRQAKSYLKNFYFVPEDVTCYQENDIMWGVQYCYQVAQELNRPIVICLGIGTSQGAHDGRSPLARFLSIVGDAPRVVVVTPAGNEGNLGRHFFGRIDHTVGYSTVELNVGSNEGGFSMELWGTSPGIFSVDILSPNGEFISRIPARLQLNREISFVFERTVIFIDYMTTETETGDQLILMRFRDATEGLWRINVYGQGNISNDFHIWLPMGDMILTSTYFIQPDNYTTVLSPGTAVVPITITAYNPINNSLYINASRGYTRNNIVKPELAAPGVNYIAPNQNKEFVRYTGTGVASAHTAGIVAMILEWGVVRGNYPSLDSVEIKNFLIRGAKRNLNVPYPNRDWGYGTIDIYSVFDVLRSDTGS